MTFSMPIPLGVGGVFRLLAIVILITKGSWTL